MTRRSVVLALVAVAAGWGCADRAAEPSMPSLSLAGASGVVGDFSQKVTEVVGSGERVVYQLDTTLSAPFDETGAAVAPAPTLGIPGPLGWTSPAAFETGVWGRYGSFVDSAGVLHELIVRSDGGPVTSAEYRRGGRRALVYRAAWTPVTGGWLVDAESATFTLQGGAAVRVDLTAHRMDLARASSGARLRLAGAAMAGLLFPTPLAAQNGWFFSECDGEWLGYIGAVLLTEVAWGKFVATKSLLDLRKAMAATATAGVALGKLVDCMVSQPDQPNQDG